MNTKSIFFNNEKQQGKAYSQKLAGIKKLEHWLIVMVKIYWLLTSNTNNLTALQQTLSPKNPYKQNKHD